MAQPATAGEMWNDALRRAGDALTRAGGYLLAAFLILGEAIIGIVFFA